MSQREALVQATRNKFSIMLSAKGAKHLNDYVQREKGKIHASKSEIQQIAALLSKPAGFQLASVKSFQGGGGCSGFMDLHYNTYASYAMGSQGKNLYASESIDGYTGEGNGSWCYGSVTHQPRLHVTLGTAGGWYYGQSVIPSSQINYGANVTLLCDACQDPDVLDYEGDIYCTYAGGNIYQDIPIPPPITIRIAMTNLHYQSEAPAGGGEYECYYYMACPNGNTSATCPVSTATFGPTPSCPTWLHAYFLVVNGHCLSISIAVAAPDAENCT